MVVLSQPKSSTSIVLCLTAAAALMTASATQAELPTYPKRYRNSDNIISSGQQVFGRKKRRQRRQQQQQQLRRNLSMNIEQQTGSMPLEIYEKQAGSMPLEVFDFDFGSMPLEEAAFSMSMPDSEPSQSEGTGDLESSSVGSSTLILASFLAGISVLVVGATTLFIKMRKEYGRQLDRDEESESDRMHEAMQRRMVSFASYDDLM